MLCLTLHTFVASVATKNQKVKKKMTQPNKSQIQVARYRPSDRKFFPILCGFIVLFFNQIVLADGVVSTDFVFQMNNSVFHAPEFDLSQNLSRKESFNFPDMVTQTEVPALVRGVTGDISYELESSSQKIFLGAEFNLQSKKLHAHLLIREISVDTVIEKIVDGVLIRARVQGACQNIPISLPEGSAKIIGAIRTGVDDFGLPTITLPYLEGNWSNESWVFGDFSCTGGDVFKGHVINGLKSFLDNKKEINDTLRFKLSQRIAEIQETVRAAFLRPQEIEVGLAGMKVKLKPRSIANLTGDGFQARGQLEFRFLSTTVNEEDSVITAMAAPTIVEGYSLMVPAGLMAALNKMAHKTGRYAFRKNGQELPAFKKLMKSRLAKFFVWPELNYFNKKSQFLFDFYTSDVPSLSRLVDHQDGTLTGQIQSELNALVWAPMATKYLQMVNFKSPFSATYSLSISAQENQNQNKNTDFVETGAILNLGFVQDTLAMKLSANYSSEYRPILHSSRIAVSTIQSSITSSLYSSQFQVFIRALPLTSSLKLIPTKLAIREGWLSIDLK